MAQKRQKFILDSFQVPKHLRAGQNTQHIIHITITLFGHYACDKSSIFILFCKNNQTNIVYYFKLRKTGN